MSRIRTATDAKDNTTNNDYDGNSNIIRVAQVDVRSRGAGGNAGVDHRLDTCRIRIVDSAGNVRRAAYDS
jgi:hypothetical protein